MRDSLFCAFPDLAPSIHLNIKAMFVFVERIQKPDIQADSNEQRFFSTIQTHGMCASHINHKYWFI
jgi:hypothetical protein